MIAYDNRVSMKNRSFCVGESKIGRFGWKKNQNNPKKVWKDTIWVLIVVFWAAVSKYHIKYHKNR